MGRRGVTRVSGEEGCDQGEWGGSGVCSLRAYTP